jgi:hypothetical protein
MTALEKTKRNLRTVAAELAQVFFVVTHNSFALLGLVVAFVVITLVVRPDLRQIGEEELVTWLQARQESLLGATGATDAEPEPQAEAAPEPAPVTIDRATAADPKNLPQEQARLAYWLSKKYRVAPEPLSALVAEAYEVGHSVKLDPTLILAVMAVESSFNPFAQSAVGAQGLMQVVTQVHSAKYENFGGKRAAFDPLANLRVGVKVLQECIARAGSVEEGLRFYVGGGNTDTDRSYADKVLTEQARLSQVAKGRNTPTAPSRKVVPPTTPEEATATHPTIVHAEKIALLSN